ncbi:hypothetical protein BH18ACT10_BH18ACT10_04980 [soil metagenome]
MDGTTLHVANVGSDEDIESVRDVLDALGISYEHIDSDPEDSYPQTAYFQIPSNVNDAPLARLAKERSLDIELL